MVVRTSVRELLLLAVLAAWPAMAIAQEGETGCEEECASIDDEIAALEAEIASIEDDIEEKRAEVAAKKAAADAQKVIYVKAIEAWKKTSPGSSPRTRARAKVLEEAKTQLERDNAYKKAKDELAALEARKAEKEKELEASKAEKEALEEDCGPCGGKI